jgi:alpha-glucosidase
MKTPWRVVLIGNRPGALLESTTIYRLNEPNAIGNTSWIKPGKTTFSWWNGDLYESKPKEPILSLSVAKKYIDFCVKMNIPFHGVIADETVTPWYFQSNKGTVPGPDTDVTRVRADLDLAGIRKYADSKGIRLWTWVHQGALRGRVEEAFAAFERLGWAGMMVDFFDSDEQGTIEFQEEILKCAARHHVLIHFHGAAKPTGLERTYPNLMNHEGALNLEYLKWSDLCTPEHNLMMPFTRMLAGPMDYHTGGFRAVKRAHFKPINIGPNVLGTRCHHLAMYVCFDNPNPMVADYPIAYEGQSGVDFLKVVPTYWDETRIIEAKIGEVLVTARRKGKEWFIGGMSSNGSHSIDIPLTFLGKGQHVLQLWRDAPNSTDEPNRLESETLSVKQTDHLRIQTAAGGGGFVARITNR